MGVKGFIKKVGELPNVLGYEAELQTMKGQYGKWLFWQEHAQEMKEDAELSEGRTAFTESYFGNLPLHAIQTYFVIHPQTKILYGDEDAKGKEGNLESPWFRPCWSPEYFESRFYLGSLIAVEKKFLIRALPDWKERMGSFEVHREEDAAEDAVDTLGPAMVFVNETPDEDYRKCILQLCEKAGGWEKGRGAIAHLPGILYHCSSVAQLMRFADEATGMRREDPKPEGLLSAVILTKDHPELLEHCLLALKKSADAVGVACEVIVVDNGSSRENREKMEKLPGIIYRYEPMEFNFSKLCNLGAGMAGGEFLLFLNDDVELLPESGLDQMMMLAARPGVGSVGLKLYYPNSAMIQHVGITNLPTGPVHKLLFLDDGKEYYFGRNRGWVNALAVSAVMLRREAFLEAGGFEESLAVAYNDVALGFRLYELGYRNVVKCDSFAYHHESLTRGSDVEEKKRTRLMEEQERLYQLFPKYRGRDPYHSDYLRRQAYDTQIRPAYETMKNACQNVVPKPITMLEGIRMDPCLQIRIEEEKGRELLGYVVVLGDDNACYDRFLIFENESGERFQCGLHGQYRPDLVERMEDQTRVALSGFWIKLEKGSMPPGKYRIGCLAKRKVGKLKLFYWSDYQITIKG